MPRVTAPWSLSQRAVREAVPGAVGGADVTQRRLKGRMLARRMVEHHINQNAHSSTVRCRDEALEVLVGTVIALHAIVVTDVVAVVARRFGDRHQPDTGCAEV